MLIALLLLSIFLLLALLMYLGKLPALIALPLLALGVVLVGGVKWQDVVGIVFSDGSFRLAPAIAAVLMGAVLAQLVDRTGIARVLVTRAAELGGDRPLALALLLTGVVALLFTTLGGLGAVIMVATIIFPILLSIGLPPLVVGVLFLLGMSLGGIFNLTNWQVYITILGLDTRIILSFAAPLAAILGAATLTYALVNVGRGWRWWLAAPFSIVLTSGLVLIIWLIISGLRSAVAPVSNLASQPVLVFALLLFLGLLTLVLVGMAFVRAWQARGLPGEVDQARLPWIALLTPVVPLVPVLIFSIRNYFVPEAQRFEFPIITALLLGIVYGLLTTWRHGGGSLQTLTRSVIDGIAAVAPALALLVGIGMVLNAMAGPPGAQSWKVTTQIRPLLLAAVPRQPLLYVLVFGALAPLALYRGPLNLYGMGAGLVAAMYAANALPPAAIMAAFFSVGLLQGVSDPTNTHNVWVANNLGIDVQRILQVSLPYVWVGAWLGLMVATVLFLR